MTQQRRAFDFTLTKVEKKPAAESGPDVDAKMSEEIKFAAQEAGLSRQYVSLLELNETSPTVEVLLRICGASRLPGGRMADAIRID